MKQTAAALQHQVLCMKLAHKDNKSHRNWVDKKDRLGTVDQQAVLVERGEGRKMSWEGEEQVLESLMLQWVQDSKALEDDTEGSKDVLEVWVAG